MKKKLIIMISLFIMVVPVVFLISLNKSETIPISMPQDEYEFIKNRVKHWPEMLVQGPPVKEVQDVADLLMKYKPSKEEVLALLGKPEAIGDASLLHYFLSDSRSLTVFIDADGNVLHVDGTDIVFASQYDRVWPLMRIGMTKEAVTSRLGEPRKILDDGSKKWQYRDSNDPHLYNIYFDENDKVAKLDKTEGG